MTKANVLNITVDNIPNIQDIIWPRFTRRFVVAFFALSRDSHVANRQLQKDSVESGRMTASSGLLPYGPGIGQQRAAGLDRQQIVS
jgi:hypothetical protein